MLIAVMSIGTLDNPWLHVLLTLLYVGAVLALDYYVAYWIKNAPVQDCTSLLKQMCHVLVWKIDGVSFFGLFLLSAVAYFVGSMVSASVADEPTHNQALVITEVFLSGAIGFHFLVVTWLIFTYLWDWTEEFERVRKLRLVEPAH